jgi:hypothetical protein
MFSRTPRRSLASFTPVQTVAVIMFHFHDVKFSCRIPGPAPLSSLADNAGTQAEGKHKAWLLGIINDRKVNGIQEFLCHWEGSSPHQWVRGASLECNAMLEEYSERSGKPLDWNYLDGEDPLLTEGVSEVRKSRAALEMQGNAKASKRKLQGSTKKTTPLARRQRPPLPRQSKYRT